MTSLDAFPLAPSPAATVDDVLARMAAIDSALPAQNGVACFNRLYRKTTEEVFLAVKDAAFADRAFMERLDVIFANRYFDAVARWARGDGTTPKAWEVLFESRARRSVASIQFAVAGMNAHINFDLGIALFDTCRERGVAPTRGSRQHEDFLRIDGVLAETQPKVKAWFVSGALATADHALGRADDFAAEWSIARARSGAWTHAEVLWSLRDVSRVAAAYVASLDHFVGFAGRGLLQPTRLG